MAIPIGTTSRNVEAMARWMLLGVLAVGMLSWWFPGDKGWGALSGGLLGVWIIWLAARTISADRTVPGHLLHLVLLGAGGVLLYHLSASGTISSVPDPVGVSGSLNVSLIFQLGLVSLGLMLTQSLLGPMPSNVVVLSICGVGMMVGALAGLQWGGVDQVRTALTLLGLSGIAVWLSPLFAIDANQDSARSRHSGIRVLRLGRIGLAAVAGCVLIALAPFEAMIGIGVGAAVGLVGTITFNRGRLLALICGVALCGTLVGLALLARGGLLIHRAASAGLLGRGEQAFTDVTAQDCGIVVLIETIGWGGALWVLVVGSLTLVLSMRNALRGSRTAQWRAVMWAIACVLSGLSLLGPGGMFIPGTTLGVVLTWGLGPKMFGHPPRKSSGAIVLVVLVCMMVILGVAPNSGLAGWAPAAFDLHSEFLHFMTGLLLGMVLSWLLGARRIWGGLVGIAIAGLSGGAGEVLQALVSRRSVELSDWWAHLMGSTVVIVPYLLCVISRWCESPDVPDALRSGELLYGSAERRVKTPNPPEGH